MKSCILIVFMIILVSFAGCTGQSTPVPPAQVPQAISTGSTTAAMPGVITIRQTVSTRAPETTMNQVPARIFNGDYQWVEYRKNITQTLPPNPRYQWEETERLEVSNSSFNGIPAIRNKITTTLDYGEWVGLAEMKTKDGWIIVGDYYYDASSGKFLGGAETNTIKGEVKPATSYPVYQRNREDAPWHEMGIMPFGEMNITLAYSGAESITVPAGTYPDARKYSGSFRDGTPITFRVAPGFPVPVQYQFPNKDLDGINPFESFELKGWG